VTALNLGPHVHSERATLALQKLAEVDPAFGSLSLWCQHRDVRPEQGHALRSSSHGSYEIVPVEYEIAPAFTDGRVIYYGTEFAEWSLEEQVAVCAHEILHVALQHIPRSQTLAARYGPRYSSRLSNVAADALINETLKKAKFKLPNPRVTLAEVLELIGSEETPLEALAKYDFESLYAQLLDVAEQGGAKAGQLVALIKRLPGDVFGGELLSTEETLEAAEWNQHLARALQVGASMGRGIGQLKIGLGDIPKTNTPWEVILRRMITKAVTFKPQYGFDAPTSRWLALEAEALRRGEPVPGFEPGVRKAIQKRGRVAVCVDVSGSISDALIQRFAGEIDGISRRTGADITLIVFDDGVHLVKDLDRDRLRDQLRGLVFNARGGTSFIEPVAEALKHDPSIVVVLTDLMGPFGPTPKQVPVVWASCGNIGQRAPFGRTIYLMR